MTDKRWVWVVGGGLMQRPIIYAYHDLNYDVLVTDGNEDCAARDLADYFIKVSTYDVNGHLKVARRLDTFPAAVVTDAADVGPTVAAIKEYYGFTGTDLFGATRLASESIHDKGFMRTYLSSAPMIGPNYYFTDEPQVFYYLCDTSAFDVYDPSKFIELEIGIWEVKCKMASRKSYPCVVKPTNNCGSRGVTLVSHPSGMYSALKNAHANHIDWAAEDHRSTVIIEEFIDAAEQYATDWLVVGGIVYLINIAKRFFAPSRGETSIGFGLELGHINHLEYCTDKMRDLANQFCGTFGIKEGPVKIDFFVDKKGRTLIGEAATRWSGGFDHTHTARMSTTRGKIPVDILAKWSLGVYNSPGGLGQLQDDLEVKKSKYAAAYAPIFSSMYRVQKRSFNVEKAKKLFVGLTNYKDYLSEGFVISKNIIGNLASCADRPVFVFVAGETEEEVKIRSVELGNKFAEAIEREAME